MSFKAATVRSFLEFFELCPRYAFEKTARSDSPQYREPLRQSPYIATATETIKNYAENWGGVWFKENVGLADNSP